MKLIELQKKNVAILGLSQEGISTGNYLHSHSIPFTVLEMQEKENLSTITKKNLEKWNCQSIFGKNHLQNIERFDFIFRSPGIPYFLPELQRARSRGSSISSNTKLFMELQKGICIGVTGTKGKGTTCKLIEAIIRDSHKKVFVGGNIGKPPLDFIDEVKEKDYVILELSSFQLQDFESSPHIAVILGIAPDHLAPESNHSPNFHHDLKEYKEAKENLIRFQKESDYLVVSHESSMALEIAKESKGIRYEYSNSHPVQKGVFIERGRIVFVENEREAIGDTSEIQLLGKHHQENICAAVCVAKIIGLSSESIRSGLKSFKGYEHRLEYVDTVNGIAFYDDSAATNPEPAIAAIEAFSKPVIIILGGSDKGQHYQALGKKIVNSCVKVAYLIGDMASHIHKEIEINLENGKKRPLTVVQAGYPSMKQIIKECRQKAENGDVILLSPACASFDMFENYKDRGNQFKKEVQIIKKRSYS